MIQGIRITSANLSGTTASVTFLPSTGGTINLGTQTIPFNNKDFFKNTFFYFRGKNREIKLSMRAPFRQKHLP